MGKLAAFFQRNWFRLALAALLLYISLKKEIRLEMDLQNTTEQPTESKSSPGTFGEKFTDFLFGKEQVTPALPGAEKFDFHPFSQSEDFSATRELAALAAPMREAFIQRFYRVAKAEQQKFGIPASIVLANALLISKAGESLPVKLGINFFNLPCTEDWKGQKGDIEGNCYRYYSSAWMSFRDHSLYITTGKFSELRTLAGKDHEQWAKALETAGFQPVPAYTLQVLQVIQDYDLEKWDQN